MVRLPSPQEPGPPARPENSTPCATNLRISSPEPGGPSVILRTSPRVPGGDGCMYRNFRGIESLSRSSEMRNRLADCRKTQNVVIPFTVNVHGEPRHAACRGISLFLSFKKGEIPHFVRNDNQK